jgi:hypothetical protein
MKELKEDIFREGCALVFDVILRDVKGSLKNQPFALISLFSQRLGKVRIGNIMATYTLPLNGNEVIDLMQLATEYGINYDNDTDMGFCGSKPVIFKFPEFSFQLFSSGKVVIHQITSIEALMYLEPFFKEFWLEIKRFVVKKA